MDWREALDVLEAKGGRYRRWRDLCDEGRAGHVAARNTVVMLAGGDPGYPPAAEMAMNAASALVGFVASGGEMVDDAEKSRRLAICGGCEHFDAGPVRCRKCGCYLDLKARLASGRCPIGLW